ncbi:MAG: PH domain-containing protein [Chloroflexota bacterium]|nr:PH domain-containing protein [Chloroflexota bacterium]
MRFRPRRWPGVLTGAGFLLLILALDAWLGLCIAHRAPDFVSFLLGLVGLLTLPLLAALSYGLYGLLNLTYDVNRNRVLIRWGASEQVIPLKRITQVVEGNQWSELVRWRGMRWLGYVIGRGESEEWGSFLSLATEPLSRQLLLITPSQGYSISPLDRGEFLKALETRRRMGPFESPTQEMHHAPFLGWPLWRDRTLWWLILAGALANGALLAYLCWRYPSLPRFLPLHFDPLGHADRIGTRGELFRLPLIELLTLLVNSVLSGILHRRGRLVSYLLPGGTIVVQALLGVALWKLS